MNLQKIETQIQNSKTPAYWYDMNLLKKTIENAKHEANKYNYKIHYALKANVNNPILKTICKYGLGADCVSGNEINKAIEVGFSPKDIVFAGVGKTDEEIEFALKKEIMCFNVESLQEIEVINSIAKKINKIANIAVRINPNIDAKTHKYITTGKENNKFGINYNHSKDVISTIKKLNNINFIGLHFHIGSQITDLKVFQNLTKKVNYINKTFTDYGCNVKYINLGGGLGIDYSNPDKNTIPNFKEYFKIINKNLNVNLNQNVFFELGRSIVGQCGSLLTKTLYTKKNDEKEFIIVDAGFTELLRPALYNATHKIENINSKKEKKIYDIAGPICETTDILGKNIKLPATKRGDIIIIRSTGAYGEVMASSYNMRNKVNSYYF